VSPPILTSSIDAPGDPNKNNIDPDKLIKGMSSFLQNKNTDALYPIYNFFAHYVRKLYSDSYIQKTLMANTGKSFLDMIGPSDVAYVICILKNNIEVWRYDPTDTTKEHPKAVFTRGESKKREFGRTTWSNNGIKYYEEGVKNWKRVLDRRQPYFEALHEGRDSWLEDAAGVVNPDGWTRKNIRNVLRTRAEKDSPSASKGGQQGKVQIMVIVTMAMILMMILVHSLHQVGWWMLTTSQRKLGIQSRTGTIVRMMIHHQMTSRWVRRMKRVLRMEMLN
jgi:hypothetical protein